MNAQANTAAKIATPSIQAVPRLFVCTIIWMMIDPTAATSRIMCTRSFIESNISSKKFDSGFFGIWLDP